MPVDVWRTLRSSVTGLDPGVVGDRPVPHLLAALLTPTCAPHARLPKHSEGRIVSSALVRHPLLGRFSRHLLFPLSSRFSSPHFFSSERFFPLLSLLTFSPQTFSLHTFSLDFFSLDFFSSERLSPLRTSLFRFFLTFLYLRTSLLTERTSRFLSLVFICPGRLPQAHPAPPGHGYHDDPCALKKGGRRSSGKNVAEEK